MSDKNVIVIAVDMTPESQNLLGSLYGDSLLFHSDLKIVHVVRERTYPAGYVLSDFPSDDQKDTVRESVLGVLNSLEEKILKDAITNSSETVCLFAHSPKQALSDYLEKVGARLLIIATRGIHGIDGLFTSSFTDALVKLSPCNVYVLKK